MQERRTGQQQEDIAHDTSLTMADRSVDGGLEHSVLSVRNQVPGPTRAHAVPTDDPGRNDRLARCMSMDFASLETMSPGSMPQGIAS